MADFEKIKVVTHKLSCHILVAKRDKGKRHTYNLNYSRRPDVQIAQKEYYKKFRFLDDDKNVWKRNELEA